MDCIIFTIQSSLPRSSQPFMPFLSMNRELGLGPHWCNTLPTSESTNSLSNYGFLVHTLIYPVCPSHRTSLPITHYDGWWPKHKTVAWYLGTTLYINGNTKKDHEEMCWQAAIVPETDNRSMTFVVHKRLPFMTATMPSQCIGLCRVKIDSLIQPYSQACNICTNMANSQSALWPEISFPFIHQRRWVDSKKISPSFTKRNNESNNNSSSMMITHQLNKIGHHQVVQINANHDHHPFVSQPKWIRIRTQDIMII